MVFDFLQPISSELEEFIQALSNQALGKKVVFHTQTDFPVLENVSLAIITVNEYRGANKKNSDYSFDSFRKKFYTMFPGNWNTAIVDLGTIEAGASIDDTYFVIKNLMTELIKKKIIPVIIGGSQDITYSMYRAYDNLDQIVMFIQDHKKLEELSPEIRELKNIIDNRNYENSIAIIDNLFEKLGEISGTEEFTNKLDDLVSIIDNDEIDEEKLLSASSETFSLFDLEVSWRNSANKNLLPELMKYKGKALVIDPDVFLVQKGLEDLEKFDFKTYPIYARQGLQKDSWGSSVMLLSCEGLRHWSLKTFIDRLHKGDLDYNELMNLSFENSVGSLDTKWNEFDMLKKDTILIHTTERLTQPWRAGLKLNSSIKPFLKFIPKAPIYKFFGRDLTIGREHPDTNVSKFFFNELSLCISKNIIGVEEINLGIKNKFIRNDIHEKINFFSRD